MFYWVSITDYTETRETLGVEGEGEYGLVLYLNKSGDVSMSILLVL